MSEKSMKNAGSALQAVITALEPLDAAERRRILDAAATFYGESPAAMAPAAGPAQPPAKAAMAGGGKPLSINEYLDEVRPSTNPQRLAAFAKYREQIEGAERFAPEDLKAYFGKAKEPEPKNFSRDFAQAVREGWIHEDGAQSYLTRKGEAAVEAGFGGKAKPRGHAVAAKRSKSKAAGK